MFRRQPVSIACVLISAELLPRPCQQNCWESQAISLRFSPPLQGGCSGEGSEFFEESCSSWPTIWGNRWLQQVCWQPSCNPSQLYCDVRVAVVLTIHRFWFAINFIQPTRHGVWVTALVDWSTTSSDHRLACGMPSKYVTMTHDHRTQASGFIQIGWLFIWYHT